MQSWPALCNKRASSSALQAAQQQRRSLRPRPAPWHTRCSGAFCCFSLLVPACFAVHSGVRTLSFWKRTHRQTFEQAMPFKTPVNELISRHLGFQQEEGLYNKASPIRASMTKLAISSPPKHHKGSKLSWCHMPSSLNLCFSDRRRPRGGSG